MTASEDPRFDRDHDADLDDPLARPPHVIRRSAHRNSAEFIRHVLAEEGIPATVERDRRRGDWQILVAEAATEDAERALSNRESMASSIDWEAFDPGEMSPRDARIMAGAARRLRLARRLLMLGSIMLLIVVLLGLLSMISDLLPSRQTDSVPPVGTGFEEPRRPPGDPADASDPDIDPS